MQETAVGTTKQRTTDQLLREMQECNTDHLVVALCKSENMKDMDACTMLRLVEANLSMISHTTPQGLVYYMFVSSRHERWMSKNEQVRTQIVEKILEQRNKLYIKHGEYPVKLFHCPIEVTLSGDQTLYWVGGMLW